MRAGVAGTALVLAWLGWNLLVPAGTAEPVLVVVAPGTTVRGIARALDRAGVVRSGFLFHVAARLRGKPLQAGEYGFGRVRLLAALRMIEEGRVYLHRFFVPEGESRYQVAAELDRSGLASEEEFLAATKDRKLLRSLGVKARTAEGYLFPDTYMFPRGLEARRIVAVMVARFFEKVPESLIARAKARGLNLRRLLTLASIVEKEARVPAERPVIAGVFHNRLKRKMLLQADPTVLYGLKRWDDRLTRRDLKSNHPYNTYRHPGLPPRPICSPGLACIEASVSPAKTPYLYFVTRKDGTGRHDFSRTLAEHQRKVRESKRRAKRLREAGSGSGGPAEPNGQPGPIGAGTR